MPRFLKFIKRLSATTIFTLAALGALSFLIGIWATLNYRYAFEYGEPVCLLPVLRMHENPWIYGDLTRLPHLLMPYNPLYLYLSYVVSWVTGANYMSGRVVTAVAAVVSAALIALICRRRSGSSRAVSAAAGLVFLASPFLFHEATHMKPDFTALAFALAGLYFGLTRENKKNLVYSAIFFTLTFLTKQTYLLGALSVAIYWISQKKYWRSLGFTLISAGLALLAIAVIVWGSHGNYWAHTMLSSKAAYSTRILLINFKVITPTIVSILVAGAVACAVLLMERRSRGICIYYLCAAPMLLILGVSGGGVNHAIEPLAAACLAIGAVLGAKSQNAAGRLVRIILGFVIGIQLVVCSPQWQWDPRRLRTGLESSERAMDEFIPILKSVQGPILAENSGLVIAAGLPVWYQAYEFAQMAYSGKFDQEVILQELRDHFYAMIIVETNFMRLKQSGRFTSEFIRTLGENYRLVAFKSGQFIYLPTAAKTAAPA